MLLYIQQKYKRRSCLFFFFFFLWRDVSFILFLSKNTTTKCHRHRPLFVEISCANILLSEFISSYFLCLSFELCNNLQVWFYVFYGILWLSLQLGSKEKVCFTTQYWTINHSRPCCGSHKLVLPCRSVNMVSCYHILYFRCSGSLCDVVSPSLPCYKVVFNLI